MIDSSRRKRKQRLGIGLIIFLVLSVFALFIAAAIHAMRQPQLDKATLCPVAGPEALTVILIDHTDPLTVVQQADLRNHLDKIKNELGQYEGIMVYSVAPIGQALLRPVVSLLCNPGRGYRINPLIGNRRLVERQWLARFSAPLDQLFNALLQPPPPASTSPIMESIQAVAITAWGEPQAAKIPRRLVIVSDMLQHTPELSQYDKILPFETFRGSPYYRRVRTDLRGVKVAIIYVRRATRRAVQGKAHIEFWQQYIHDMGGVVTGVDALQG